MLPDGLDWLCYLAGRLKASWEFHFLHIFDMISPNQVEIKNVPIQGLLLTYSTIELSFCGMYSYTL